MSEASPRMPYDGPIALGMVFDFEPDKKHLHERLTVSKIQGPNIWAFGRSGETYHEEKDFRRSVVFVADKAAPKAVVAPVPLAGRYEGPIAPGMVFDFETGKKALYERLTIWKIEGEHIWALGHSGQTYYTADDFRDHVARVPEVAP